MIRLLQREQFFRKLNFFLESPFGTPAPDHVLILEVSSLESFQRSHIRGAIHFPPSILASSMGFPKVDRGVEIIIYGENRQSPLPREALRQFEQKGYFELYYYPDGKEDWMRAGLPIEFGLVPADGFTFSLP